MIGINLAGAEFGSTRGVYGTNYIYPNAGQLDYYASKGIELIRLPFGWERMQPTLGGPLNEAELGRMTAFLDAAAARGMKVVIDCHNYGRYDGQTIGSGAVTTQAFADFWQKLAGALSGHDAVYGYGLMNEPHGLGSPTIWPKAAQAAVDAIRTVDGNTAVIVSGDNWANASKWLEYNANLKINDPANNVVYEAHQYFDKGAGGTYTTSYDQSGAYATMGYDLLKPFLTWLDTNNLRGFLGEFAVPDDDPRWLAVLDNVAKTLEQHDVMSAYWAGGPWWGKDRLAIEPINGKDRPQMDVLERYVNHEAAPLSLIGGISADILQGGGHDDYLVGGEGNDTLSGSTGHDIVHGDGGADRLLGDNGDDTLFGGDGNDTLEGGNGNDVAFGGLGNDRVVGDAGNDTLHGNEGADSVAGGLGNDTLFGDDGDDVVGGHAGNDELNGGVGNDKLYGDVGTDVLKGGDGQDWIEGGGDADQLWGNGGADKFVFGRNQGVDTIHDFRAAEGDRLILNGQGYTVRDTADGLSLTLAGGGVINLIGLEPAEFLKGWIGG